MTELHATNLRDHIAQLNETFYAAVAAGDREQVETVWRRLLAATDGAIRCSRDARAEADALATELLLYRPTRHEQPPAPPLGDYCYVFTAKAPWVCAAVELRKVVTVQVGLGCSYSQDHYVPERHTLCGRVVTYPVSERFTSGGWPRLRELCPDCTAQLAALGLLTQPHHDAAA